MTPLAAMLAQTPYVGYAYAYPHKTAYRPLEPPVPLREVWAAERREALFLYLHVPFCEMRCGFCNLFTTANPQDDFTRLYLEALRREARRVREALGPAAVAQVAMGGGTPTYLDPAGLHALFDLAEELFEVDLGGVPISIETSPRTAEPDRLRVLRERGVDRVSIGVQSFVEAEAAAAGRAQKTVEVEQALARIREAGFPALNVDLIYGLPGQTVESWLGSLRAALRFAPEELYLYPLYVRPLTGLGRRAPAWDDLRLACYRAGRALLLENGYAQVSMRMFRRLGAVQAAVGGPVYCCQQDGMVGLGCGARSYTRGLHYSTEYAVGARGVRSILADYVGRPEARFDFAEYGCRLGPGEQRRRCLLQSLLQVEGLSLKAYRDRFGTAALEDVPELAELAELGLACRSTESLRLTETGLERSDLIGPWLYSEAIRERMEAYELR
jgi:oxygen-independent coproporphyrinogen III oxidase